VPNCALKWALYGDRMMSRRSLEVPTIPKSESLFSDTLSSGCSAAVLRKTFSTVWSRVSIPSVRSVVG
jgi:hypothetical protein